MKRFEGLFPDWWLMAAFLVPFGLFLATLAPSVTFYDSGEFITAVYGLGSAHSPGYPLFLLFAKPFTWLPFGSLAFRVNLATAFSGALCCVGAFVLVRQLLRSFPGTKIACLDEFIRNGSALAAALLFATTPRLWLQTNHDKPYPLLAFLVAVTFLFLVRWRDELMAGCERPAWWYGVGFVAGLASGAHQTIILLVPAWLVFVMTTAPRMLVRARELVLTAAFAVAGGAVQLYLPLRAAAKPLQNWGDPRSLSSFLWHVLRRGYPEEPHGRDMTLLLEQVSAFSIPREFGWIGLAILLVGIYACWQRHRPFVVASGVALVSFWGVVVGVFNPQPESIFLTEEFYTPLYLLAAVLIAIGLYTFLAWGMNAAEQSGQNGIIYRALALIFLLLIPGFQLARQYADNDQHANYIAHDYAVNSLRSLPEQAVLFTWGDSGAFPLWYLQRVERLREDLDLPHIPHLVFNWYQAELPRLQTAFSTIATHGQPAESVFLQLAAAVHYSSRPVLMDYSTRYSLDWKGLEPAMLGFVYFLPFETSTVSPGTQDDSFKLMALHRLGVNQSWRLDQDSYKAVMIAAYSLLQTAEAAARSGHGAQAELLFNEVQRMVPDWKARVQQLRQQYALTEKTTGEVR